VPGSTTTQDCPGTRVSAPGHVAFRLLRRRRRPDCVFSKPNTQPTYSPVYASLNISRRPAQNSGPSGLLLLSREEFSSSASCRFIPALRSFAMRQRALPEKNANPNGLRVLCFAHSRAQLMLTQAEADELTKMAKHFIRPPARITIPPGTDDTYELTGPDGREAFLLDIWRGTLRLSKLKFQNRVRTAVILVRLDVDGAPHTNPDGARLPGTHLHLFREGYEDRWAYAVDRKAFSRLADPGKTFHDFCALCRIESPPPVQGVIT
jgi:hypothetical protein